MAVAKLVLHVHLDSNTFETRPPVNAVARSIVTHLNKVVEAGELVELVDSEWITDWDEETADDVPLDAEHPFVEKPPE